MLREVCVGLSRPLTTHAVQWAADGAVHFASLHCSLMALSLCLNLFLTHSVKPELGPTAQAIERTEGSIVWPIHLILFPKSLYCADQVWFSRLLVGCLRLHRYIRRKTCVGDVSTTRVRGRKKRPNAEKNNRLIGWVYKRLNVQKSAWWDTFRGNINRTSFKCYTVLSSRLDHQTPSSPQSPRLLHIIWVCEIWLITNELEICCT